MPNLGAYKSVVMQPRSLKMHKLIKYFKNQFSNLIYFYLFKKKNDINDQMQG